MRPNQRSMAFFACVCVFFTAFGSNTVVAGEDNTSIRVGHAIVYAPMGWVRHRNAPQIYLTRKGAEMVQKRVIREVFTRDGTTLNMIEAIRFDVKDAFPGIEHARFRDTTSYDWARMHVAEQYASRRLKRIIVNRMEPVQFSDNKRFLVEMIFKRKGMSYKMVVYGFVFRDGFYTFSYKAPELYYFDRDYVLFKKLVDGLQLVEKSS